MRTPYCWPAVSVVTRPLWKGPDPHGVVFWLPDATPASVIGSPVVFVASQSIEPPSGSRKRKCAQAAGADSNATRKRCLIPAMLRLGRADRDPRTSHAETRLGGERRNVVL